MSELVTLLTPTGGRPDAWKLCERYMHRQTYKGPLEWIVVDDMLPMQTCTRGQQQVCGPKPWRAGINTQRPNCDLLIQLAKGEYIFWIEDDDWYAPNYIETMLYLLQRYDAVGEANNRYFALTDRSYIEFNNTRHASLCSTAFRRKFIPVMEEVINSGANPFFDTGFWSRLVTGHENAMMILNTRLNIGMKQLPGRTGIGAGHHNTKAQGFTRDPMFEMLRNWVGADADDYIKIATGQHI